MNTTRSTTRTSWFGKFRVVTRKNVLLLMRRPLLTSIMIFSSLVSVILAWLRVRNEPDFSDIPLTACGTINSNYYDHLEDELQEQNQYQSPDIPLSYNEDWRLGFPVTLMALGPMFFAITVFVVVSGEIQAELLGVLRVLSCPDSVYWASWLAPLSFLAVLNSLIAAITAKSVDAHVFQHTYFGGIFLSFLLLNMSLTTASFFLAAIRGTSSSVGPWLIFLMFVALWIPQLLIGLDGAPPSVGSQVSAYFDGGESSGLWWVNYNTTARDTRYVFDDYCDPVTGFCASNTTRLSYSCDKPIIAEDAMYPRTQEEASDFESDDYFLGCFFTAGFTNTFWNPSNSKQKVRLATIYFFPYIHFTTIWSSFAGYTSMPGKSFKSRQASFSVEELALRSLPTEPDESNSKGSAFLDQSPMIRVMQKYTNYERDCEYVSFRHRLQDSPEDVPPSNQGGSGGNPSPDGGGYTRCKEYCPASTVNENFCGNAREGVSQSDRAYGCAYSPEPAPLESPSVNQMMGYQVSLFFLYLFAAMYWIQIFPGKNGTPRKPWYFLLPSFWFEVYDESAERDTENLIVKGVKKQYGDFEALKGVDMEMKRGEVSAILGHNGAGKSQLTHIIAGEIPASNGDAFVFGSSVTQNRDAVQSMIGVCRQDDYLYPDLTAREHLELYGRLKDLSNEDIADIVDEWLQSVDLSLVGDDYTGTFSGGMKRRLSVALATIGGRPLLLFDEPTTGMDPSSRRFVWKHIDAIKKDRVVLLTTHAMEEADLLADAVFIMRKGEIVANGTPLNLKAEFGSAIQFSVLVEDYDIAPTVSSIRGLFGGFDKFLKITEGSAGNLTVTIKEVDRNEDTGNGISPEKLAEFVEWLDSRDSKVKEYGFSNSSLEEVFLKVTEGDVEARSEANVQASGQNTDEEEGHVVQSTSDGHLASFTPQLQVLNQTLALLKFSFSRNWTGRTSLPAWIMYTLFAGTVLLVGLYSGSFFDPVTAIGAPTTALSMLIVSTVTPVYTDRHLGTLHLQRAMGMLRNSFLLSTCLYSFTLHLIFGFLLVSLYYATPMYRPPKLCQGPWDSSCRYESLGRITYEYMNPVDWWNDTYEGEVVTLYASHSPGSFGLVLAAAVIFALAMPGATLASLYVPNRRLGVVVVMFCAFCAGLTPLIMHSVAGSKNFEDQESCLTDICGVNITAVNEGSVFNSTIDFLSDGEKFVNCVASTLYSQSSFGAGSLCMKESASILPQVAFFQMLALTFLFDVKLTSDPPQYIKEYLIPSLGSSADCSENGICSFQFAHSLYGKTVGYAVIGIVILTLLGVSQVFLFDYPPTWILSLKNFFTRGLCSRYLSTATGPTKAEETMNGKEEECFEEVIEEETHVASLLKAFTKGGGVATTTGTQEVVETAIESKLKRDEIPPVLMHKLRKVYPAAGSARPKLAVDDMSLHVDKGKVLGLLGQNGCGKSTTLKILSIEHEATSGDAFVAGYDVSREQIPVFERLGSCPQFDIVWPQLTVKQHLEFFSSLKGLPPKEVATVARQLAEAVGLGSEEKYTRCAGDLSGGMRRRLSMAISLVGAPDVLLLDEPSTGLDPSTRNSIWGLIHSFATPNRALIITTHMMIEADTLCNRIAIMSHGRLKIVATQQHLKNKFGDGYLLQLNLLNGIEGQETAMNFVRENLHQDARLQTRQAKTLYIVLPRDIDLRKVFRALYSKEASEVGGVNQFLLSQSSLEDVFLALVD